MRINEFSYFLFWWAINETMNGTERLEMST